MLTRVFSVMQRRDDLPEMTLPLAALMILLSCAFSCAGAMMLSAAVLGVYSVGLIASLPFLSTAACMYSLIILLWRRFASLLVTPISLGIMLAFGIDTFSAVAFSTSVLLCAYIFAVSMISRETKFRRMTSLAVMTAVCIILSLVGYIGLYFGTFDVFLDSLREYVTEFVSSIYISLGKPLTKEQCLAKSRDIIVMIPAVIGNLSILIAAFTDVIAKAAFRLLDCENVFIELTSKITMPKTYALVYFAAFVLLLFTSGIYNPLIYAMLKSVTYVMILPCAIVGLSSVLNRCEDEFFYMNGRRITLIVINMLVMLMFGFKASVVLASALGVFKVVSRRNVEIDNVGKKQ